MSGTFAAVPPPPIVNPTNGNIYLPARSGATIAYRVQDVDGNFVDLSAAVVVMEIAGVAPITLTPGGDPTTLEIVLPESVVGALPVNTPIAFAVRDKTGTPTVVTWSGYLRTYGLPGGS